MGKGKNAVKVNIWLWEVKELWHATISLLPRLKGIMTAQLLYIVREEEKGLLEREGLCACVVKDPFGSLSNLTFKVHTTVTT